ncbi:MAG: hypothetical protein GOV15_02830, partial [Candidatus Diapherotrites archaeon]|nr:hypothetical protein [Candidatus Diapherotrites archaeon]
MRLPVEYIEDEGTVYYRGSRSEILGNGFFSHLQKEMEDIAGPAVRRILYNSAKKSGYNLVKRYKKRFFTQKKLQSPTKQAEFLIQEIPSRGLGKVVSYELDKELP